MLNNGVISKLIHASLTEYGFEVRDLRSDLLGFVQDRKQTLAKRAEAKDLSQPSILSYFST
jgi:hypothetical protein